MLREGNRSKQWHQVNEIQVAKCDIFHSGMFCNTTNQSSRVYSLWWARCSGHSCTSPRQRQRSKKIGYLFQILLRDLLLSMDLPLAGVYRILKHISAQRGRSSSNGKFLEVEVCQLEWRISFSIMQR